MTRWPSPIDRNRILLILLRHWRDLRGVQVPCLFVARSADNAGNRRTVHVDVEDIQKDADALGRSAIQLDGHDARDLAVRGQRLQPRLSDGNDALRITERTREKTRPEELESRPRRGWSAIPRVQQPRAARPHSSSHHEPFEGIILYRRMRYLIIVESCSRCCGYIYPVPRDTAERFDKNLSYLAPGNVLTILTLNGLHLVLEPELQFLQPDFFQLFVVGEISLVGER